MRESIYTLFRTGQSFVVPINESQFSETVFNSALRGSVASLDITTPPVLEVHIFVYSMPMVVNAIDIKTLKCSCSYSSETLVCHTVQNILKV